VEHFRRGRLCLVPSMGSGKDAGRQAARQRWIWLLVAAYLVGMADGSPLALAG
jgi:hypothetical protein